MKQGLIYDPTASIRIDEFLTKQEEEFKIIDSSQEVGNKKVIRIAILFGISALLILGLKVIVKK